MGQQFDPYGTEGLAAEGIGTMVDTESYREARTKAQHKFQGQLKPEKVLLMSQGVLNVPLINNLRTTYRRRRSF